MRLSLLPAEPDISLSMKEALYRIAQEAMHNIAKHARASTITVRLDRAGDALIMEIEDDGIGFDSTRSFPGHLGLVSMQERAAPFGGTVSVESAPGAGTRVRVFHAVWWNRPETVRDDSLWMRRFFIWPAFRPIRRKRAHD